ncbi:MAG TPA: long-chain fatty acid--CoA ligase [Bacteroidales bacterium]|jgi:long-chain acyl-CoA synthetase|nr:long-chain fatty acid--CoA ligase [Bacteroidales bacterium]MBP9588386.1 long-chain fatty acid--CoA ligase [Bacteroidales bacterium]HOE59062.1 long-chain fatty acid--CoA ligase [Bacteroidales bacterium]HOR04867.1 long-chain fatty acid--CoA ligase [Bacteroidales bacterium]HOU34641.1 long-chain fatty acid--CoA ligase [Bacteroidales bacterium]
MQMTRTFDLLDQWIEKYPRPDVFGAKRNGRWIHFSAVDYKEFSESLCMGLMALGFVQGDKIATITANRPEWNFVDMGLALGGFVHVPIYPTLNVEEYYYILEHSDTKLVFVGDKSLYAKIKPIADALPQIQMVVTFNEVEGAPHWMEIVETGRKMREKYDGPLKKIKNSIKPDDLVTIIYTSGTTGKPKGVMLSHWNIMSNAIATSKINPLTHEDKVLSFLPLSHIYERMMNYDFQYLGIGIYYAENMGSIVANLNEIQANEFNAVPRLLENVYDRIVAQGKDLNGIKKAIFFWALHLAERFEFNNANGWFYDLQLKWADKLVFVKWREALGGHIKVIVSGGSSLQERLCRIFWGAGLPVVEGYGLTETSPVIAVGHFNWPDIKFGTVGPVLEGVEVKIANDGEILVKGPNVMLGYYKDPEYTAQVIDEDGFFHTGDIGVLVDGKFLKITDRKKEIFKLSAGKYIAPQVIENKFKESIFIEEIMIIGENEKFVSAFIVPNLNYLHFWASKHKIHYHDNRELIKMEEVIERIDEEVQRLNKTLSLHEQVKRFRLVADEWSPQTGEQSPTLKLRREVIYAKYSSLYEEIYGHPRLSKNNGKNSEPHKPSKYAFNLNLGLKFKPKDKSEE